MHDKRPSPNSSQGRKETFAWVYTWVFIILDFYYIGFFGNMVVDPCLYAWGWATHITSDFYYMVFGIHINMAVKKMPKHIFVYILIRSQE